MNFQPLAGAARLAIGRADGVNRFGDTTQSYLASLAPLLAFPLVGAAVILLSGRVLLALTIAALVVVTQLAPAVLSHSLAARWDREAQWFRYATAFNWCQWAIAVAAFAWLVVIQVVVGDLEAAGAQASFQIGITAYGLWLHWIIARNALEVSRGRATIVVAFVTIGTAALVLGPGGIERAIGS